MVGTSGLIFVAVAVAWAAYLVPKALRYHEDVARSRSVDRFSQTMRVLARREPVDRTRARLVVTKPSAATGDAVAAAAEGREAPAGPTAPTASARQLSPKARREAARRAAQRRRRVLGTILALLVVTAALAAFSVVGWAWVAAPAALLVAWLVACRLMVRHEHGLPAVPSVRLPHLARDAEPAPASHEIADEIADAELTTDVPVVTDTGLEQVPAESPMTAPGLWDPVPVTLPTYVDKPAAVRRTVRTIDLDSTGVWTSGRTEADASLAREADALERRRRAAREDDEGRALGS